MDTSGIERSTEGGRGASEDPSRAFADGVASSSQTPSDDWSQPPREAPTPAGGDGLIVDVEGWEGPLDLLLTLARHQKVDLARISILDLVDQYLAFVERVRERRLELAADHLVMAAWLTYLKSRLLLPRPPQDDEPSGEELAAALAFRLRRLEAMRDRAAVLMARPRVGRDHLLRGAPEATAAVVRPKWEASLYDLLSAYADFRQRGMITEVRVAARAVWSLADAREILERLIGPLADWMPLDRLVAPHQTAATRVTLIASTFAASLEMAREGLLDLSQAEPFAPLMVRARAEARRDDDGGAP